MPRPARSFHRSTVLATLALIGACADARLTAADPAPADPAYFTTKVLPIIKDTCFGCHGPEKHKGKLRLDSRAGWIKGGEDGAIVVVGDPDKSPVVDAIKYQAKDDDDNMPPKKKNKRLTPEQVSTISDWIKAGLVWPDDK